MRNILWFLQDLCYLIAASTHSKHTDVFGMLSVCILQRAYCTAWATIGLPQNCITKCIIDPRIILWFIQHLCDFSCCCRAVELVCLLRVGLIGSRIVRSLGAQMTYPTRRLGYPSLRIGCYIMPCIRVSLLEALRCTGSIPKHATFFMNEVRCSRRLVSARHWVQFPTLPTFSERAVMSCDYRMT